MAKKSVAALNKELEKAQQKANAIRQELKEARKKAFVDVGEAVCKAFPDVLNFDENYDKWCNAVAGLIKNHQAEFEGLLSGKKATGDESPLIIGREGHELPPPHSGPLVAPDDGDING